MTQDEIIEMAIEAEFVSHGKPSDEESELFVCVDKDIYKFAKLVAAKAIAELESQEPVACGTYQEVTDTMNALWAGTLEQVQIAEEMKNKKLYTAPTQRTWVGIEGEEIRNLWEEATKPDRSTMTMVTSFAKSIEAKLKEKNT